MKSEGLPRPLLLVEDNPADVELTLRAFRHCQRACTVEVARDGEEAVARLAAWEAGAPLPMLVLLDLNLPRVDGLEVLRRFKTHPLAGTVPVVVLTTSEESSDLARAYALGVNSYIVKPVEFDKFIEVASQVESYWCALNRLPYPSARP